MTTETDWRAEPDPMVADAWAVFLYLGERRQSMVVGNLSEPTARLIAAAPAKAALCEELADALELLLAQTIEALEFIVGKGPDNDMLEDQPVVKAVQAALAKAGRAPQ